VAPDRNSSSAYCRCDELEPRVRALEQSNAQTLGRLEPVFALAPALQSLTQQLGKVERDLAGIKAQAILLGGFATVVAPGIFALVEFALSKWK
jgi:hypothetical protein